MDESAFLTLIDQLRRAKFSTDKFYLLRQAVRQSFFTGEQVYQLVSSSFPHSDDKRDAVALLEARLCRDVDCATGAQIIKDASFSNDRIQILKTLLKHMILTKEEGLRLVSTAFELNVDKDEAWTIICLRLETDSEAEPRRPPSPPPPGPGGAPGLLTVAEMDPACLATEVKKIAQSSAKSFCVFELPLLAELESVKEAVLSNREAIEKAIGSRKASGHAFLIPSRVWAISTSLKPGRRLCLPPLPAPSPDEAPAEVVEKKQVPKENVKPAPSKPVKAPPRVTPSRKSPAKSPGQGPGSVATTFRCARRNNPVR